MFLTVMVLQLAQVQSCLQSYTIFLKCPFVCSLECVNSNSKCEIR